MILGLLRDRDGGRTSARAVFGTQLVLSWEQLVPAGYHLGTSWYQLVLTGTQLVPAGIGWYQLVSVSTSRHQLVPSGTSWYQLVQLVPSGTSWS